MTELFAFWIRNQDDNSLLPFIFEIPDSRFYPNYEPPKMAEIGIFGVFLKTVFSKTRHHRTFLFADSDSARHFPFKMSK